MKNAGFSTSAFLFVASLAACSSSSNAPADARDASDADASAADASTVDVRADASDGLGDLPPGDAAFVPPSATRRLVAGRAALVGSGANSCTYQPDATGDRWCGFFVPAQTGGKYELWVLDATRAAAGADVRCDGTDPSCLRLAADALYYPYGGGGEAGFAGDTLLYRSGPDANLLSGPVLAWRPGWGTGRVLVTGNGTACSAPGSRPVAICIKKHEGAAAGEVADDLLAGPLTAPGDGPLPLLETVLLKSASDAAGAASDFEFGFSPDGAYVAWSTVGLTSSTGLKVKKLGDASAPLSVTTGVSSWRISNDGASWLWLRAYSDDGLAPSGTLEAAVFPAGTNVTTLAAGVGDYENVGAKGLLYRVNVADQVGDLRLMPDRAAPAASTLVDHGVRTIVTRSADASTVVYSKTSTGLGTDLFAWSAALAAPCTLTSTPAALSNARLMAADQVVAWVERDVISQELSGETTSLTSCQTEPFGRDLLQSSPASDDRLLFIDGAPSGAVSGTLRALRLGDSPAEGTPLQRDVEGIFAPLAANAVVYTVAQGKAADGLYVYAGPLLGASSTQPASDAGSDAR